MTRMIPSYRRPSQIMQYCHATEFSSAASPCLLLLEGPEADLVRNPGAHALVLSAEFLFFLFVRQISRLSQLGRIGCRMWRGCSGGEGICTYLCLLQIALLENGLDDVLVNVRSELVVKRGF